MNYRESQAYLMRKKRAAENDLEIPKCKNRRRRNKCEKNPVLWLKTYLSGWFTKEFSPNQLEVIADLEDRLTRRGLKCVAMDRGGGKTTIGKGMMLSGLLRGLIRF